MTLHDASYPAGGGGDGGLSPFELHKVLALSGGAFQQGETMTAPAGNIDIAPTVLELLGLEVPGGLDGRVLREAFRNGAAKGEPPAPRERIHSSSNSQGPVTHFSVTEFGSATYLNRAWVE